MNCFDTQELAKSILVNSILISEAAERKTNIAIILANQSQRRRPFQLESNDLR